MLAQRGADLERDAVKAAAVETAKHTRLAPLGWCGSVMLNFNEKHALKHCPDDWPNCRRRSQNSSAP